ncbi:MAG: hypothetical protein Q7R77_00305 [Candidatus Daviesbacteria bacterium]|nr:hypothetical protein [Candidatus Daviesbacteria bacterium]
MLQKFIVYSLSFIVLMLSTISLTYAAGPSPEPCINDVSIKAGYGPCPAGLDQIEEIVGKVISVIVGLGFIAMLAMVVMAGIKYLTSGGEPKAVQAAHQAFTWAILGILFMIIAWLTLVLIENFTGIKVTTFNIKSLY